MTISPLACIFIISIALVAAIGFWYATKDTGIYDEIKGRMKSCTIIISHFESLPFLKTAVRQTRKYANKNVEQSILVIDQSCDDTFIKIKELYDCDSGIKIVHTLPLYSGFGLDYAFRYLDIKTDYIAQLHSDAFPISDKWLTMPIALIEESSFSFVGQLQCIGTGNESIYPPSPFFAMAQCFNVAKTETYKELSLQAGFTRFHNRPQSGLTFENNDWEVWASDDYEHKGSDDDVVAFSWNGKYNTENMFGLAITGFIAPAYGRIIEDVVFHFGSCRESIGTGGTMGSQYAEYTKRINEDYSDLLIDEMVNKAKANTPPNMQILTRNYWNGKLKYSSPTSEGLNKRIEELKNS